MKREISYEEIERDLAELKKALKTIKKKAPVEKAINNIIENVKFQARELHRREQLFKIMPAPASIMDVDGRRIDANDACCEYFKRAREEYVGAKLEEMYAKEDAPKIKKCLAECKETGFGTCEVIVIKGDGTRAPAIVNLNTVRDESGNIINIIGTAQDITELRKREEELKHAISNFGSVLSAASAGDLTAKVDLSAVSEGYKQIGKDINKMISATEKNITELRRREQEQANAILSFSKVLGETVKGNLSARIDTKGWSEELETIGITINTLIESLEFEKKQKK
jgi:PAS domain S-box-containing protein